MTDGETIKKLADLLEESLDCVDADETARRESWPEEVESGDLVLDMGVRIRQALQELKQAKRPLQPPRTRIPRKNR